MDIIRAWKDKDYRMSLSDAEQALLPDNPAGMMELSDTELEGIGGGTNNCFASNANNCNNSNDCVSAVCTGFVCQVSIICAGSA